MAVDISRQEQNVLDYNHRIAHDIVGLCKPLLENFGICFFSHVKIYKDSIFHICNYPSWTEVYVNNKLYELNHYQTHIINMGKNKTYNIFWDDNKSTILKTARHLGLGNAIALYKKKETHIEMWNFGAQIENKEVMHLYMNGIDLFERFIVYFKNIASNLIDTSDTGKLLQRKNKIILDPDFLILEEKKKQFIALTALKKFRTCSDLKISISKREAECLYLLSLGKTAKEMARILKISHRTVEWYITFLKEKLQCPSREKLIRIFEEDLAGYYKVEFKELIELMSRLK